MPFTEQEQVAVALVYQSPALNEHVRNALGEFGARLVYETASKDFQLQALEGSGASVVVVNLDPDVEEDTEQIEQLLFDEKRKVIFNDGEVTSKLSGWDQARWARHLVSKILGGRNLLPARPLGAEAVSVREMPQHGLDSVNLPMALRAPSVSAAAEAIASREITEALAAFTVDDVAVPHQVARNELEAALEDFGFFADATSAAEPAPESAAVPPISTTPKSAPIITPAAGIFDDVFSGLDLASAAAAEVKPVSTSALAPPGETASPFDALFGDAADSHLAAVESPSMIPADDFDFSGFDMATEPAAVAKVDDDSSVSSGGDTLGLDAFLALHAMSPDAPTHQSPSSTGSQEAADDDFMAGLSFDLEALESAPPEAAAQADSAVKKPTPTLAVAPVSAVAAGATAADLTLADLDALALMPLEVELPPPPVAVQASAPARVESVTAAEDPVAKMFAEFSFELEAIEDSTVADTLPEDYVNPFADIAAAVQDPAKATRAAPAPRPTVGATAGGTVLKRVWVLGASIGGPDAVREFLGGIPANSSNLFLLAQHMGADFVDLMATQLARATGLQVKMAVNADSAAPGQVLIVPLAERLLVDADGVISLVAPAASSPYSPSIDQVLFDVADRFGSSAGAIIFSGMAHDAIEGAKYLASKGGVIWAQDPATCVVSSMIDGVIEAGIAQLVASPAELAARFVAEFP